MEENYLLAKKIVDKRFDNNNEYYYMFICALFGLFMKFPDNKDLIIKTFMDTKFIIEDIPILDIQKKYDLNLIHEDELASMFEPELKVIVKISNDTMYQVTGLN